MNACMKKDTAPPHPTPNISPIRQDRSELEGQNSRTTSITKRRTLVRGLPERSQAHTAVQSSEAFVPDDRIHGVSSIPVLRDLSRVRERMHLRL